MSDTHWKARRLAARSLKVLARHGDEPAIAAYTTTLGPKATTYIREYDTAGKHEAAWRREMAEGHGAMSALQKEMNAWKPHVARERPGFDLTTIGDRPTVPEDLVQDAIAMAEELEAVRDAEGNTPEWAIAAAASIREKAVAAERETDEAAAADATYKEQLAKVRDAKAELDAELSRFRETLRVVLGRSHPDFQKLRVRRAAVVDVDDDPNAPPPSEPVTPAPAPPA